MIDKAKCFLPVLLFALAVLLYAPPSVGVATLPTVIPEPAAPLAAPSPRGVVKAPEKLVPELAAVRAPALAPSSQEGEGYTYKDGVYRGVGTGYNGTITVEVTVNGGRIASVAVLSHIEDQEYWSMAASRVINSIVDRQSTNVDTVSGATYTANGIILAVRDALRQAVVASGAEPEPESVPEPPPAQREDPPEELPVDNDLDTRRFADGTYTGTAEGYNGDITVEVLISEGEMVSVTLLSHREDREYLDKALAVTNAILLKQSTNVDVVSGATYTSVGIVLAVRDALLKAAIEVEGDSEEDPDTWMPILPPDPDADYLPIYGLYNDGEYTGSAAGYEGFIFVKVTIVDNSIAGIEVTRQIEEPAYYKSCIGILDRIVKRQTTDGIDAVSGATYTSNGLLGAVGKALDKARITG